MLHAAGLGRKKNKKGKKWPVVFSLLNKYWLVGAIAVNIALVSVLNASG